MDNFKISQSSFKSFYIHEAEFCPMRWYKKYVLYDRDSQVATVAQQHGNVFEYKCIGANVNGKVPTLDQIVIKNNKPNGNAVRADLVKYLKEKEVDFDETALAKDLKKVVAQMPDDKVYGPSAPERAINEVVELFKANEERFGIKNIDVQFSMSTDEMMGTVDRRTTQVIDEEERIQLRDLKFAGTKYEKEYMTGWSQPTDQAFNRIRRIGSKSYRDNNYLSGFIESGTLQERINYMKSLSFYEKSVIQAIHYCILYFDIYGIYPQFFFDVYGKSGWQRIRQVIISQESVDNHRYAMDIFRADLAYYIENGFDYDPKYTACRTCDYSESCPVFKKFPEVEQTVFE